METPALPFSTLDRSDAVSAGIFSQRTNRTQVPGGAALPFSTLEHALRDAGDATYSRYYDLAAALETADATLPKVNPSARSPQHQQTNSVL